MAERHRCQIDLMIDEIVTAGKSEQDILTAIVAQYRPYDTLPAFDEGFNAYQTSATRMTMPRSAKTPSLPVSAPGQRPSVRPRRQRRHVALARAAAHEATGKVISETSASAAMPSLLRTL
jgi:hypothetical protein